MKAAGRSTANSRISRNVFRTDLWYPERRPDRGVVVHDREAAQDGLTLYVSGHEAAAFLIDMEGEVVHEWRRPFSDIWDETSPVARPQPDSHVYFRKAMVYPNGDLLVVYEGVGDTPYGYGVAKLDKDSEVIWTYHGRAHHDIDIGPDGRIYALTHEFIHETVEPFSHLSQPFLDDFLVILSPDGEEEAKVSLIEAMRDSAFRHMVFAVPGFSLADPLHTNTVGVVTEEQAEVFPFAEAGQVLLSFRELTAVAVLDVDEGAVTWAKRAYWLGQHDPDILDNGNMLLFDNFGNYDRDTKRSRVIEFNPETAEIVWQYEGTVDNPLDSEIRSDQERLANGNTLITESNGGRLVEVTPEGEIAWEYINPVRGGENDNLIPIICWGQRIDPGDLDADFIGPRMAAKSTDRSPRT